MAAVAAGGARWGWVGSNGFGFSELMRHLRRGTCGEFAIDVGEGGGGASASGAEGRGESLGEVDYDLRAWQKPRSGCK